MSHNIKRIAAYRIVRVLGEGGMGTVYEAQHESISRRVAIKVLKPEFAKDKDLLKRFFNEARAANEINHPGVIKIWDADTLEDGTAYLVMELLEGQTLAQYLAAHPGHLEMNVLLDLAEQLTQTMLAAHSRMIIHRDLKPDNIMLLSEPGNGTKLRLKILDFGIAKLTQALGGGNTHAECMGTPTYCPPEQIQNAGSVDEKADVYSLGCILYECASGAPPFEAVSVMEMMAKQLFVKPRRLTEITAHIGMDLADLVDQMLSKQPTERPNMEQIRATILEVKERCAEKTQMLDASYLPGSPAPILPHDLSLMDFRLNSPRATRTSKELIAAMVGKVAPKWRKLHRHAVVGVALGMMMLLGVSVANRRSVVTAAPPPEVPLRLTPKLIVCRIEASPASANVRTAKGEELGELPLVYARPEDTASTKFIASAPGYIDQEFEVGKECQASLHLSLTKLPRSVQSGKRHAK